MERKYTFVDGFVAKVEGYLSPEEIRELEKEHNILYSVTTGNQEVKCCYD